MALAHGAGAAYTGDEGGSPPRGKASHQGRILQPPEDPKIAVGRGGAPAGSERVEANLAQLDRGDEYFPGARRCLRSRASGAPPVAPAMRISATSSRHSGCAPTRRRRLMDEQVEPDGHG